MAKAKEGWQWEGPGMPRKGRSRGRVAWAWENRPQAQAAISGQHMVSRVPAVQGAWYPARPGARSPAGRKGWQIWHGPPLHLRTACGGRCAHPASLQGWHRYTLPSLPTLLMLSSSFHYSLFSFSFPFTAEPDHIWIALLTGFLPRRWLLSSDQGSWTVKAMRKQLRNASPKSEEKTPRLCVSNGVWILEVPIMLLRAVSRLSAEPTGLALLQAQDCQRIWRQRAMYLLHRCVSVAD